MKNNELTLKGKIDSKGNLLIPMKVLTNFLGQHKGKGIIATFNVYSPNDSKLLQHYYYNGVIPSVQKGFAELGDILTSKETIERLELLSPWTHSVSFNVFNNSSIDEIIQVEDLTMKDFISHIDFIKQYAAENLHVYICDPNED